MSALINSMEHAFAVAASDGELASALLSHRLILRGHFHLVGAFNSDED